MVFGDPDALVRLHAVFAEHLVAVPTPVESEGAIVAAASRSVWGARKNFSFHNPLGKKHDDKKYFMVSISQRALTHLRSEMMGGLGEEASVDELSVCSRSASSPPPSSFSGLMEPSTPRHELPLP